MVDITQVPDDSGRGGIAYVYIDIDIDIDIRERKRGYESKRNH